MSWGHLIHSVRHAEHQAMQRGNRGEVKAAAVAYIIVGLFLTPVMVGIPIVLIGIYKLFTK